MMDLQAALGIHQLERVEKNWLRRRTIWELYQAAFSPLPLGVPAEPDTDSRHAYHLYTLAIDGRDNGISREDFIRKMGISNIGVGVHYSSLAQHPYYQERFGWHAEEFPVALQHGQHTVSLPLSPSLTDAEISRIVEVVTRAITERKTD